MKKSASKPLTVEMEIPVLISREKKTHVAYAPTLELASRGDTRAQARKHFDEVVKIFFEEVIRMGTLDEVLADLEWTREDHAWRPPVEVKHVIRLPARMPVAAR
ncbi:hypothetical protein HY285_01225 [Candidatus Peregrinibacteria bacterium]|nr:hypothetical protein [Candidatus Peregrinibacteria bacterium]MBI3816149.1 hypothetical protein [Candidatus Peregrinibacteria bacterium]